MTDSTLNRFLARGTNAERLAFTVSAPSPASGPNQLYLWYATDTETLWAWDGSAWDTVTGGGAGTSTICAPMGRLTLTTNTPVMSADATAQSSVYYSPYVGEFIPIYSGASWAMKEFAQLTLSLDTSNHLSGSVYDVFVWNDSGVIKVGSGPAWTSATARGTGAGTTELERKDGFWTNKNSITLKNGAGAGTTGIAANTATYVGTIYCTANGQTGMAFKPAPAAGGTNNILGVYNAYNRVLVTAACRDNTASWAYNSTTYRATNGSNSNRVSYIDGLAEAAVQARTAVWSSGTSSSSITGMSRDSTSATPEMTAQQGGSAAQMVVIDSFSPSLGFHYVSSQEATAANQTFLGATAAAPARQHHVISLSLEM